MMSVAPMERLARIATKLRRIDDADMAWMAEMIEALIRVGSGGDRCSDTLHIEAPALVERADPFDRHDMHPRFAAVLNGLRRRLGDANCGSWILKLSFVDEVAGVVTLAAPNSFIADHINAQFDVKLLDAWKAEEPSVRRVEVRCPSNPIANDRRKAPTHVAGRQTSSKSVPSTAVGTVKTQG